MRTTPRLLMATAVVVALAVALPAGAGAGAATQPSAQAQAKRALNKLARDTTELPRKAATARNKRALLRTIKAARGSARKNPCRSITILRAYRRALGKRVKEKRLRGLAPGTSRYRGKLASEALAANIALLALPKSRRCGGGRVSTVRQITPTVVKSDQRQLQIKVALPKPLFVSQKVGGTEFQQMLMEGMGESGDVGKPGIPQNTKFFGVPVGADVKVTVRAAEGYDLKDVNLYPHQDSPVDAAQPPGLADPSTFEDKPFSIDSKTYNSRKVFPDKPADGAALGSMRGLQLGGVGFAGGQYNPRTDTLHVFTSIDVTIDFGGGNQGNFGNPDLFRSPWNAHFLEAYKGTVTNFDTVAGHLGDFKITPAFCGEEMLIVTSPALQPAATTFATARKAAGFLVQVAVVGAEPGQIGTTNTEIQSFIRNELTRTDCLVHPTYVVLFGDTSNVPTFIVPCSEGGDVADCDIASDLPYSLDGVGTDLFADVMLGRIPAADIDAATAVVTKIVNYETTMPAPAGDDFYGHATVASYWQQRKICVLDDGQTGAPDCDSKSPAFNAHWEPDFPNHRDARGFTKTAVTIQKAMEFFGYSVDGLLTVSNPLSTPEEYYDGTPLPSYLKRPAFQWDADHDDFLDSYNGGRFLVLHRDHGSHSAWSDPTLTSADVPKMTNGAKLPVVFSVNCASAMFDIPGYPSFVERQVMKPDGGAFAAFGDTRDSPTWANNHMALGFFDALFPNTVETFGADAPTRRLGDVLLSGKSYMASQNGLDHQKAGDTYVEHFLYHLLGDPSGQMWAQEPMHFDLEKVSTQYRARADGPPWEIVVNLPGGAGNPAPEGTILTLLQNGQAIGRGIAGPDGAAVVAPEVGVEPKNLSVALDQDGALPAQDNVDGVPQPAQKTPTSMSITCPARSSTTSTVPVSGTLTGAPAQSTVQVKWTPASGAPFTHDVTTDANDHWLDRAPTPSAGQWRVDATYDGDATYEGSTANCGFPVG